MERITANLTSRPQILLYLDYSLPVPTPPINVESVEPCFDPPMPSSSASSQGSALLLVNHASNPSSGSTAARYHGSKPDVDCNHFFRGTGTQAMPVRTEIALSSDASKSTKLEHSQTVVDCILRLNIFKYTFEWASLIQFIPVTASRLWHSPAALRRPNLCQFTDIPNRSMLS
ncbi:hypothetical protein C8J57DRAFT_1253764 [Mycena rebaudengoi]|nr:hypothetical protein C8J57DRAFT_1253764 [Mycena rebaudengoi]